MADYLPQADPSGTCCDCPSRTGPCDNCSPCGPCSPPWTCPGGCTPPVGTCVKSIQFEVKVTQCEIDSGFAELLDIGPNGLTAGLSMSVFWEGTDWKATAGFAGDLATVTISNSSVPLVACSCYDVMVAFNDPGGAGNVTMTLCVNGTSASVNVNRTAQFLCTTWTTVFFGDFFGGDDVVNRKYRHMLVSGSPGFNSDTDSFDTLTNASVITEGGVNVLLVNSAALAGYGQKTISLVINCSGC